MPSTAPPNTNANVIKVTEMELNLFSPGKTNGLRLDTHRLSYRLHPLSKCMRAFLLGAKYRLGPSQ
jgi:hypothetical protein